MLCRETLGRLSVALGAVVLIGAGPAVGEQYFFVGGNDWAEALSLGRVQAMTHVEWFNYMYFWDQYGTGNPYPQSIFVPPEPPAGELYPWAGGELGYPLDPGLVTRWVPSDQDVNCCYCWNYSGESACDQGGFDEPTCLLMGSQGGWDQCEFHPNSSCQGGICTPDPGPNCCHCYNYDPYVSTCDEGAFDALACAQMGTDWDRCDFHPDSTCQSDECVPLGTTSNSFSSAWTYSLGEVAGVGVDLSDAVITVAVTAPQFDDTTDCRIDQVAFAVRDVDGVMRAWSWEVGPSGPIPWDTAMAITIDPMVPGMEAADPPATGYMDSSSRSRSINMSQIEQLILDSSGPWTEDATPIPPPGGGEGMWDYSHYLRVGQRFPLVKWNQAPDLATTGIDVNASWPFILADDFQCDVTGPITEIRVWGSWLNDVLPLGSQYNVSFTLSLHDDVPDPDGPGPEYSKPGGVLWTRTFDAGDFMEGARAFGLQEGWLDPPSSYFFPADTICWEYVFILDPDEFIQQGTAEDPIVYWLDVQADPLNDPSAFFGWKTSLDHWNDDAVWGLGTDPPPDWYELIYPPGHSMAGQSIDLAFKIIGPVPPPVGACCLDDDTCVETDEVNCVDNLSGTYQGDDTECGGAEACCLPPLDGGCVDADALCCVNELSGTPQGTGTQCGAAEACCLPDGLCETIDPQCCDELGGTAYPGEVCAGSEACCLPDDSCVTADAVCCENEFGGTPQGPGSQCTAQQACCYPESGLPASPYLCSELAPECCDDIESGTSMGEGSECGSMEACCTPDGDCIMADTLCCANVLDGAPQGPGSTCGDESEACCLPDGTCMMADALCCENELGGTPQGPDTDCTATEACCLEDGECQEVDPICCPLLGGTAQGLGTDCSMSQACCLDDGSCQTVDPICCDDLGGTSQGGGTACSGSTIACCLPDGTCLDVDPLCCDDVGGTSQGGGTACSSSTIACCLPDGTCLDVDSLCCDDLGGEPSPSGEPYCLGDLNGNDVDDACEDPTVPQACCSPDAGTCSDMPPDDCAAGGGTPQGPGTQCTFLEACCFADGICDMIDPLCCDDIGGTPQGSGTTCGGDPLACCLPDGTCEMVDPLCCDEMGGTLEDGECEGIEACCEPIDRGTACIEVDALCCREAIGTPQGPGTTCSPDQACCSDGVCTDVDPLCCVSELLGTAQGPGSSCSQPQACCLPDNSCEMADPLCCDELGGTIEDGECGGVMVACCLEDGTCVDADPICCEEILNGTPSGDLTPCSGLWESCCIWVDDEFLCEEYDPVCCTTFGGTPQGGGQPCMDCTVACCLPGGDCMDVDPVCCDDLDGQPAGLAGETHCLGDLNGNGIDDACEVEVRRPMAEDCASIPPGTRCNDTGTCTTDADCAAESHCVPPPTGESGYGVCYVPKTRYLSIARHPEQAPDTAMRVKLDTGDVLGWAGEPYYVESTSQHSGLWLADIVEAPYYASQWPAIVHVIGCEVAHASLCDSGIHCLPNTCPGSEACENHSYFVQAIVLGNDPAEEENYSEVLELRTPTTWGDTVSNCAGDVCRPPDAVVGLDDIMAAIKLFQGTPAAPLTWLDIDPSMATQTPDQVVGLGDIMGSIAGFQGQSYPGDGPLSCSFLSPHVGWYSDSGCLPGSRSRDYPWCDDDEVELTVGPGMLHVMHRNATYWCAQEDIAVYLSVEGNVLWLTEVEVNPEPTDCLCCYDVEATVVDLAAGPYTVVFCWSDYESGWEQVCHTEDIVIP